METNCTMDFARQTSSAWSSELHFLERLATLSPIEKERNSQ